MKRLPLRFWLLLAGCAALVLLNRLEPAWWKMFFSGVLFGFAGTTWIRYHRVRRAQRIIQKSG